MATDVWEGESSEHSDRTERLARLYLVLSRTNRAIEHAIDDRALLQVACETIIEVGGFLMSWVGKLDPASGAVTPIASCGHDEGYLDFVQIHVQGVRSEGPTGQAIRLERTIVCNDIATDSRMEPWRQEALRRGFRSSVGLPLYKGGLLYGVLTVYSDWPDRFDAGERELLEELATNVSFGLTTMEEATERKWAQVALIESEHRFRATAETLLDPFVILGAVRDETGRIVDFVYEFANEAACTYNRVSASELVGKRLLEILPGHEGAGLIEQYAHCVETGEPLVLDDLEYSDIWGDVRSERIFDVRGSKIGDAIAYTWRDNTERRHAERRRAEELERRVRERTAELEVAQRRAAELAGLSKAMLDISDPEQVGRTLFEVASRVSGAIDGVMARVLLETERMDIIGSFGFDDRELRAMATTPATVRLPIRDVAKSGEALVFENVEAFRKRYRHLTSAISQTRDRARVSFPLRARDSIIGGVTLGFEARTFDDEELDFFVSLANAAALALERIRLATAESAARGMLDTVVAQMPVSVAVTDRDGRILYRNNAFDEIFKGVRVESLSSGSWIGLRPDNSRYRVNDLPAARSLATGEVVVNEEMKVALAGGKTAAIMQTSAPVRDPSGVVIGAVVVTVDITQRKETEELQDAFLSVLSHELRTPVTTISAGAQFLAKRGGQLDPSVMVEVAQDVAAESDRLCRMIDDLLVLARAERGMDLSVSGLTSLQVRLPAVIVGVGGEWPDRHFSCDMPAAVPPVNGDDGYLDQVLWNLLGNAAKYGRKEVIARVKVLERQVELQVLDDGPGIPPGERDRIFELFARVEATSKKPGSGIGLFVVRRLVTSMGGSIGVANRPEGGAVFTVTLPVHVVAPDDLSPVVTDRA
jgi:PAS domain S-box-containing protein